MQTKLISQLVFVLPLLCCLFVCEVSAELSPLPGDFGGRKRIPLDFIQDDVVVADLGLVHVIRNLHLAEITELLTPKQRARHDEIQVRKRHWSVVEDLRFICRKRTLAEKQPHVSPLFNREMIADVNGCEEERVKKPAADAAAIKIKDVTIGDLKLSVPEAWKLREPKSEMRLAEYEVPPVEGDKQPGEFVVSYDQGQEGNTKRNFEGMTRGFEPKGRSITIRDGGSRRVGFYELVDITGTYNKPVGPPDLGKSERLEGWRAVKVYLSCQNVRYVLKIDGPARTVESHLDGLRATFGGDAKKEREWR